MTQKEIDDLTIDILTFFDIHHNTTSDAEAPDVANAAIDCFKGILERYPKIRYCIWQFNQQHILDDLDLDYGHP
jgi:hypothetical protein